MLSNFERVKKHAQVLVGADSRFAFCGKCFISICRALHRRLLD
jgi:hypothetical protein